MTPPRIELTDKGLAIFWCPGCKMSHGIQTEHDHPNPLTGARWRWNGSMDLPTFAPSILVRGTVSPTMEEVTAILAGCQFDPVPFICHSFVTDGRIQYLNDCTHELSGQTVELPEVEQYSKDILNG